MKALSAVLLVVASSLALADEAPVPKHLELARELVATVTPENNHYNATPVRSGITWKDGVTASSNKVDAACSDFVAALLEHSGNKTFDLLKTHTKRTKIVHTNNFLELAEKGYVSYVQNISEVKPGDVFIWKCGDTEKCKTSTTGISIQGHTMLVDAPPERKHSLFERSDSVEWKLVVIDSTELPHGSDDTRNVGLFTRSNGVGRGSVSVFTDADGHLTGYSSGFKPVYNSVTQRALYFVRPLAD
jgi:hypothetical protein